MKCHNDVIRISEVTRPSVTHLKLSQLQLNRRSKTLHTGTDILFVFKKELTEHGNLWEFMETYGYFLELMGTFLDLMGTCYGNL